MSEPGALGEVVAGDVLLQHALLHVLVLDVPHQHATVPGLRLETNLMFRRNKKYDNIYLRALNSVQPVEKFIGPERISVSLSGVGLLLCWDLSCQCSNIYH